MCERLETKGRNVDFVRLFNDSIDFFDLNGVKIKSRINDDRLSGNQHLINKFN